jgi:hypothetical protein
MKNKLKRNVFIFDKMLKLYSIYYVYNGMIVELVIVKRIENILINSVAALILTITGFSIGLLSAVIYFIPNYPNVLTFADIGGMLAGGGTMGLLALAVCTIGSWKKGILYQECRQALSDWYIEALSYNCSMSEVAQKLLAYTNQLKDEKNRSEDVSLFRQDYYAAFRAAEREKVRLEVKEKILLGLLPISVIKQKEIIEKSNYLEVESKYQSMINLKYHDELFYRRVISGRSGIDRLYNALLSGLDS